MLQQLKNEKGLTLIELCLAILILGLLVVAVAPRLAGTFSKMKIKSAAEKFAAELRLTRQQAAFSGTFWRLRITDEGRVYCLEQEIQNTRPRIATIRRRRFWQMHHRILLEDELYFMETQKTINCSPSSGWSQAMLRLRDGNGVQFLLKITAGGVTIEKQNV